MQQTDRRQAPRLEFVGDQWGSLDGQEALRLRNVGREGALVEAAASMPVGSIQAIRLVHESDSVDCRAAVRHFLPRSGSAGQLLYLIGLQFLNLDEPAIAFVDKMLAAWSAPPLLNEA
jgi:PilZ domain